jgi:hypothetical protein
MTLTTGKRTGNTVELIVGVDRDWFAARIGLLRLLMGLPPCQ